MMKILNMLSNSSNHLRDLAGLQPDLVVNTGDNLAHPKAVPAVVQTLGDLLSVPGVFVFGSNDYFGPKLKNPANYLTNPSHRTYGEPLPWQDLRAAFTERGCGRGSGGRSVAGRSGGGFTLPHLEPKRMAC